MQYRKLLMLIRITCRLFCGSRLTVGLQFAWEIASRKWQRSVWNHFSFISSLGPSVNTPSNGFCSSCSYSWRMRRLPFLFHVSVLFWNFLLLELSGDFASPSGVIGGKLIKNMTKEWQWEWCPVWPGTNFPVTFCKQYYLPVLVFAIPHKYRSPFPFLYLALFPSLLGCWGFCWCCCCCFLAEVTLPATPW